MRYDDMVPPRPPHKRDGSHVECSRCGGPARAIVWLPGGCACSGERLQALCTQHLLKLEPLDGFDFVEPAATPVGPGHTNADWWAVLMSEHGDDYAAVRAAEAVEAASAGWRCFHCGAFFTDRADAEAHFGGMVPDEEPIPACVELQDPEGLVRKLRDLERAVDDACAREGHDAERIEGLQSALDEAVRRNDMLELRVRER